VKHKHRIKPGYEGGEYVEGNNVELTVIQHAMWHFAEWQRKGSWQDRVAWKALAGISSQEDIVKEVLSEAGKKGAEWNRDPRNKHLKMHRKGKRHNGDAKRKMREAHKLRTDNPGDQLRKVSKEQRAKNGKKGLLSRWGFNGLYPKNREFRVSLSETFVDYFLLHGHPTPKRVRKTSSASARLAKR